MNEELVGRGERNREKGRCFSSVFIAFLSFFLIEFVFDKRKLLVYYSFGY